MIPIIRAIYPYVYILFIFLISLSKYASAVPNIVLIVLVALFPFVIKKEHFLRLKNTSVYLFIGLLVVMFLNTLFLSRFEADASILTKIASSLLLLTLALPLPSDKKINKAIVFSVLVSILVSLIGIYFLYQEKGVFEFASGGFINDVLLIERLYLGFICTLSIIISVREIDKGYSSFNKWYFANSVLCILFVILISSRIAIVSLLFLFVLRFLYIKRFKIQLVFTFGLIAVLFASVFLNNNLKERVFFTHNSDKEVPYIELFAKWEPRVAIWNCNLIILKNSPSLLSGIGFKETRKELTSCYNNTIEDPGKRDYFIKNRFNSHNQYFDFFISQGLISGILFILFMAQLIWSHRKSYYNVSLISSLFLFTLIECVFQREFGAYLFGIIWILLLFNNPKEQLKDE